MSRRRERVRLEDGLRLDLNRLKRMGYLTGGAPKSVCWRCQAAAAVSKGNRPIVEKIPFVDVRDLAKAGAFSGGEQIFPWASLRWPFLTRLRTFRFRADLWMRNATRWTCFPVEWTRCTFGGRRPMECLRVHGHTCLM